jgi:hypothetical protein
MKREFVIFVCGTSGHSLEYEYGLQLYELEAVDRELRLDLERENYLAREFSYGRLDQWPWYADDPYVIVEPEIIDGS